MAMGKFHRHEWQLKPAYTEPAADGPCACAIARRVPRPSDASGKANIENCAVCQSRAAAGRLGTTDGWRLAAWLALEWLPTDEHGKHLSVVVRRDDRYHPVMSTLVEIESAAKQLPESDRQRLLISLIQSLRLTSQPLPPPRLFSLEEMRGWMDEDEADLKSLRVQK